MMTPHSAIMVVCAGLLGPGGFGPQAPPAPLITEEQAVAAFERAAPIPLAHAACAVNADGAFAGVLAPFTCYGYASNDNILYMGGVLNDGTVTGLVEVPFSWNVEGTAPTGSPAPAGTTLRPGNHVIAEEGIALGIYRYEQEPGGDFDNACYVQIYAGLTDRSDLLGSHFSDGDVPGPYFIEITPEAVVVYVEGCPGGWKLTEP